MHDGVQHIADVLRGLLARGSGVAVGPEHPCPARPAAGSAAGGRAQNALHTHGYAARRMRQDHLGDG
eukprot:4825671-Pyramimonas_sp.AAC.1